MTTNNAYTFNLLQYINQEQLLSQNATADQKTEYMVNMGFTPSREQSSGAIYYKFNANTFAKHLAKCIHAVQTEDGNLYIYNKSGYYQECDSLIFGRIIQFLMNQGEELWKNTYEEEAIRAFIRGLKTIVKQFNHSEHINLQNGVLDLRTMELLPHSPTFYSTIQIPVKYDPSAECPRFRRFVQEIMNGDEELCNVIQEVYGYCLTDSTQAEKAILLYGRGSNGKSVLAKTFKLLVGDENISAASLSDFNSPFGMESMVNKKINLSAENELKGKLNSEYLKAAISGDVVNIHRKYEKDLRTALSCKIILLMNSLPEVSDTTYGFFRKILIIPFTKTFTEKERDIDLISKLEKEGSGILTYALEGLQRLQKNRYQFSHSKAVDEVMRVYQISQNPTIDFFEDTYEYCDGASVLRKEIYEDYMAWVLGTEYNRVTNKEFWKMMRTAAQNPVHPFPLDIRKRHGIEYLANYKRKEETSLPK